MTQAITCELAINGRTVADSAASLAAHDVTALDGLSVQWGRRSRLDQPEPATLSATLALPSGIGAPEALEDLQAGMPVSVTASYTAPLTTTPVFTAPSETLSAGSPAQKVTRIYPPATFAPEGHSPDAWDEVPQLTEATTVTVQVSLSLPEYTGARVVPVYFNAPWPSRAQLGTPIITATHSGSFSHTFRPNRPGMWVGVAVIFDPDAPLWRTMARRWPAYQTRWHDYTRVTVQSVKVTRTDRPVYTATVFSGRITDIPVTYSDHLHRPVASITAAEYPAEMANIRIGSKPWPRETARERIERIISEAGIKITAITDSAPGALTLAPLDVDRREPWALLQDIAHSTGAILWPATHAVTGDYVRLEDLDQRKALYALTVPPSGQVTIDPAADQAMSIPAAVVQRSGITIRRDTTDLATTVEVRWKETTTDQQGEQTLTDRVVNESDTQRLAAYGYRLMSVQTDLTSEQDARRLAARTLDRTAPGGWQIPAATWDTTYAGTDPLSVIAALDSTRRIGLPLMLTGVASWVPGAPNIPVYLDGGTFTFDQGRWLLAMTLTRAATRADSVHWQQVPPAVTFDRLARLTWAQLSAATI